MFLWTSTVLIVVGLCHFVSGELTGVSDVVIAEINSTLTISWKVPKTIGNNSETDLTYAVDYCVNDIKDCINGTSLKLKTFVLSKLKYGSNYTFFIHVFDKQRNKGPIVARKFRLKDLPGDVSQVSASPVKLSESSAVKLSWKVPSLNGRPASSLSYKVTFCKLNFPDTCQTLPRTKELYMIISSLKGNTYYQYKITVFDRENRTAPFPHEHYFKTQRQNSCKIGFFRCTMGNQCVFTNRTCNGIHDCGDGSDERLDAGCSAPKHTPTDLKVVEVTKTTATIQWRAVPLSDRPLLYMIHIQSGDFEKIENINAGFGQITIEKRTTGLSPNKQYTIKVKAVNIVGSGDFAKAIHFLTDKLPELPLLNLPKSANVTPVKYHESTKVILTWLPPSDFKGNNPALVKYQVNYCTINTKCSKNTEKTANTSVVIDNLIPRHIYQYTIRVFNENGDSDDKKSTYTHIFILNKRDTCHSKYFSCFKSNQCVLHTRLCDGVINCRDRSDESLNAGCSLPIFNVANIEANRITDHSIVIEFNPSNDPSQRIKGYEIENTVTKTTQIFRHTALSFERIIKVVFKNLKPATEYGFRIRAINPTGNGKWSRVFKRLTTGSTTTSTTVTSPTSSKTTTPRNKPPPPTSFDEAGKNIGDMSTPQKIGVAVGIVFGVATIILCVILLNKHKIKRKKDFKDATEKGVINPNFEMEGQV